MTRIIERGTYRHFKGKTCYVRGIAEHSETGEALVMYSKIDLEAKSGLGALESKIYARPYEMFSSEVDKEKYPYAKQKYRFELIEDK